VTRTGSTTDAEDTRKRPCRCARVCEPYHRGHGINRCIPTRRSATVGMTDNTAAGLTPRGRVTFARITGSAADLIYRRGLSNTTVADVRDAASVSGSQLTHYFADKRALIHGVVAWRRDEVMKFSTNGQHGSLDSFAALQEWADRNIQLQIDLNCSGGCIFGSLAAELVPTEDDVREELVAVYDELIGLLRAGLAAMRKRGDLRADADPRHLARVVVTAHQGGSLLSQTTGSIKPLRDALTAAMHYVRTFATDAAAAKPASARRARAKKHS
jgi:TetR/AcrR family transcriptional repressor of nem operon